ncbi:hypothetical protein niasHS_014158 [Heterodera schachtii]|uniref:Uncharacterized protein n=1 Tax=Heterodera schachtii TaxID=97005 RepID=A0ABD2IL47_HETSC
MPLGLLFVQIGAILLLLRESTESVVKCRKHFQSQQQKPARTNQQKLSPLSDQFAPFDYDFPDYSAGVFIDAVPISPTTKRALIGKAMATKKDSRNRPPVGKVRTFEESARRAEWYETLFGTRR